MFSRNTLALFAFFACVIPTSFAVAQPARPGVITGRVFNVATGEYIRNAEIRLEGTETIVYSEDGGFYRLQDVPAGPATLTASYASVRAATGAVNVPAGGEVSLDFELKPLLYTAVSRAPSDTGDDIVMLDKFDVSGTREGQAKAIMEQRAAINAKTVIATDNFGQLTMGDVGEFMKYMPGVTLHYEVDAHDVRIGGLDPKYTTFSQDGAGIATSTGGRNASMMQMSITGIEAIEFNQTLTASMDAGTGAGIINLKSKNTFDRKNPFYQIQVGMNGAGTAIEMRRSYYPDDKKHLKTFPGGQIGYARSFFNRRLGVDLNLSYNETYSRQNISQVEYTYPSPNSVAGGADPDLPAVSGISNMPGQQHTTRFAGNLSLDWKISNRLVFSLRSSYSYYTSEYNNPYTWLRTNPLALTADSTLEKVTARPTTIITNNDDGTTTTTTYNPSLGTEYSYGFQERPNWLVTPKLVYKNGPLEIALTGGYSDSRTIFKSGEEGFFTNTYSRITRLGWTAERSSTDTPAWNIAQLRDENGALIGADWSVPENWGARDGQTSNARNNPYKNKSTRYSGSLDVSYKKLLFGLPFLLKTGAAWRTNEFSAASRGDRYTYIGEDGRQTHATVPWTKNYIFKMDLDGKEGNVNSLGWRVDNSYALWDIFQANPGWFTPDIVGNHTRAITGKRHLEEDVKAAYFEANTKVGRLRLNAGLRYERTETDVDALLARSTEEVKAAGYDPATVEGVDYRYYNGQRFARATNYDNFFLSGGAKFDITRNLQAQLSASQSIQRPDYNNLAGVMTYNDDDGTRWIPNPNLKPERLTKYFVSLQQRIRPGGMLGLSAYRMDIADRQIARVQINREEAEALTGVSMAGDPDDIIYRSTRNASGTRTIYGLTIDYNQQLTFLPGVLKGLGVFGSYTRTWQISPETDDERVGYLPNSANGGLRYRYGRLNLQLRATWQDDRLQSITRPATADSTYVTGYYYYKGRMMVDFSGDFKLNKNLWFIFSLRNITNTPAEWYSNTPDLMQRYFVHGVFWNCGLKARF